MTDLGFKASSQAGVQEACKAEGKAEGSGEGLGLLPAEWQLCALSRLSSVTALVGQCYGSHSSSWELEP